MLSPGCVCDVKPFWWVTQTAYQQEQGKNCFYLHPPSGTFTWLFRLGEGGNCTNLPQTKKVDLDILFLHHENMQIPVQGSPSFLKRSLGACPRITLEVCTFTVQTYLFQVGCDSLEDAYLKYTILKAYFDSIHT